MAAPNRSPLATSWTARKGLVKYIPVIRRFCNVVASAILARKSLCNAARRIRPDALSDVRPRTWRALRVVGIATGFPSADRSCLANRHSVG